ncbi:MAG: hypothetical protein NVSMB5_25270 [Candidatus Velthaea sp.]
MTIKLRREGFVVKHKRVHRIYCSHGLRLRARRERGVSYVRRNAVAPVTSAKELWESGMLFTLAAEGHNALQRVTSEP